MVVHFLKNFFFFYVLSDVDLTIIIIHAQWRYFLMDYVLSEMHNTSVYLISFNTEPIEQIA